MYPMTYQCLCVMCKRLFTTTYYLQLPTKSTTYNYLSTVTLHNLFTLYTFDNIGAGLCMVRIGKGGYLNVPYDTFKLSDIVFIMLIKVKVPTIVP